MRASCVRTLALLGRGCSCVPFRKLWCAGLVSRWHKKPPVGLPPDCNDLQSLLYCFLGFKVVNNIEALWISWSRCGVNKLCSQPLVYKSEDKRWKFGWLELCHKPAFVNNLYLILMFQLTHYNNAQVILATLWPWNIAAVYTLGCW